MYLAIERLSPKMTGMIVNVPQSPRVSEATWQVYLLSCFEALSPFLAFERPHLTSASLAHTNVGQLAFGLMPIHNTHVCLVYLQARP